jgi:hypothetical protein
MPQLDKFTFLDQSLTVLFFFLFIYILSVYFFMPKILFIIRFRNRFFSLFKTHQFNFNLLLNDGMNRVRIISKQEFSVFYSFLSFILLQSRELLRVLRLTTFKN